MLNKTPLSWILVLIGMAAIVAAIILTSPRGPLVAPSGEDDVVDESTPREETFSGMLLAGPNAVYVETQTAGKTEVRIGIAVMENSGFVAIHADDDGVPGRIIGVSELEAEGSGGFTMEIDEVLVDGQVYYAVLYEDDGDGEFEEGQDRHVLDSENNVIMMSFEAQEGY